MKALLSKLRYWLISTYIEDRVHTWHDKADSSESLLREQDNLRAEIQKLEEKSRTEKLSAADRARKTSLVTFLREDLPVYTAQFARAQTKLEKYKTLQKAYPRKPRKSKKQTASSSA